MQLMRCAFLFIAFVSIQLITIAQSPQKMSYQSVVRDGSGDLITNDTVGMKLSILQGSASGTVTYAEAHQAVTNDNGLATLQIGTGSVMTGVFDSIDWAVNGPFYLKTETDPSGGTNYSIQQTSQFLSVPFAMHAKTADVPGVPGPEGPPGPQGPEGPQGTPGPPGPGSICSTANTNFLSKFTSSGSNASLCNTNIYDDGTNIGIYDTTPAGRLHFTHGNAGGIWLTQWDHSGTTDAVGRFQNTNASNPNRALMGITNYSGSTGTASAVTGLSLNSTTTGTGGVGVQGSANNESGNAVEGTLSFSGAYTGWAGYFNADVYCAGTYFGSDRRLKKDIKPIESALNILDQIEPVAFYYNTDKYPNAGFDENRLKYGYTAQNIEKILPEVVKEKNIVLNAAEPKTVDLNEKREVEKFKLINYTMFVPILTQAIKEQQTEINSLRKDNEEIKIENKNLRKRLNLLESEVSEIKKLHGDGGN